MIPRGFDYHDPPSEEQALDLLVEYGDDGKLMAGGMSLLPMMKLRLASPAHLIDLWNVGGLDGISEVDDEIRIGSLVTHRALEDSDLLLERCPLLARAAATIGDAQVRNMGTVGGAIAHADPAANYPPALIALGATFVLRAKGGNQRLVAAADFFKDLFETELAPTELLTEVRVPALAAGDGWDYVKLSRRIVDFAMISVAAIVRGDGKGNCTGAEVVLGSVGPVPWRAVDVETALRGEQLDPSRLAEAARATVLGAETPSDVHADAAYRKEVAPVCVRRALEAAVARMNPGR